MLETQTILASEIKKIYLVMKESMSENDYGDSEFFEEPVKAFTDKEQAEKFITERYDPRDYSIEEIEFEE